MSSLLNLPTLRWQRNALAGNGFEMALTSMCLRVEEPDGRTVAEYRIRDEAVEFRKLPLIEDRWEWHRLTAEELANHVNRKTVVAQWLMRRLGWRRLLRACVHEQTLQYFDMVDSISRRNCRAA